MSDDAPRCVCGCGTELPKKRKPSDQPRYVLGHQSKKTAEELFLQYAAIGAPDECWEWSGRLEKGYGAFQTRRDGKRINWKAHRYAYERSVGPIPAGMVIDHLCENPVCVNPRHLEAVTQAENLRRTFHRRDSEIVGAIIPRRRRNVRLSWVEVDEIRARVAAGESQAAVARSFALTVTHVGNIVHHRSWPEEWRTPTNGKSA